MAVHDSSLCNWVGTGMFQKSLRKYLKDHVTSLMVIKMIIFESSMEFPSCVMAALRCRTYLPFESKMEPTPGADLVNISNL
jgi:hypothetical protein